MLTGVGPTNTFYLGHIAGMLTGGKKPPEKKNVRKKKGKKNGIKT